MSRTKSLQRTPGGALGSGLATLNASRALHSSIGIRVRNVIGDAERLGFSWSGYAGSRPILGKFRDTSFRLQKRRYYRNSFAPFFFGRFVASDGGTLIEGEFRMHPFVRVFMIVWFSFLGVFSVIMLISVFAGQADVQGIPILRLIIPAGMAAFGVALVKFGRWLGRSEETAIVAFLQSTLETNDAA